MEHKEKSTLLQQTPLKTNFSFKSSTFGKNSYRQNYANEDDDFDEFMSIRNVSSEHSSS